MSIRTSKKRIVHRERLTAYDAALIDAALRTVMKDGGPWESAIMRAEAAALSALIARHGQFITLESET